MFHKQDSIIHPNDYVSHVLILHCDMTVVGVILESKLYSHCHIDFIYSQALKALGLIRYITYNLSSLDSTILYIVL
jgi:hypothetical protein